MRIAVVVLNWNGAHLLQEFLPSVVTHSKEATIYVADNASTDNSLVVLDKEFPTITCIKFDSNNGYAGGYNKALANLEEDLFILLNSDVKVSANWLKPIQDAFINNPKLMAAQPKILDYKNPSFFEYAGAAGGYIDALGYPFCRGRIFMALEKDLGQYNNKTDIFWASGACLAVTRNAFIQANGFDEDLFAHHEEIDLCWRMQHLGGQIIYIPESVVYHLGGATLQKANPQKTFYNFRNTLLLLLKNVKGPHVYGLLCLRLFLDGIAGVKFLIEGDGFHTIAVIKSHLSFYSLFPKYLKKRKHTAKRFQYASTFSVVWQYFICKRKTYNTLKILSKTPK